MRLSCIALTLSVACAGSAPPVLTPPMLAADPPAADSELWVPGDADAGVGDSELAALLREHWGTTLAEWPVWATKLGVHRYDHLLGDNSYPAVLRRREQNRGFVARAERIDRARLDESDRVTLRLFVELRRAELASDVCESELWSLSPRSNPITEFNRLPELTQLSSPEAGDHLLARYRAIPRAIDRQIENLRIGAGRGLLANAHSAKLVLEMVDAQLKKPLSEWPLLDPTKAEHVDWPPERLQAFRRDLRAVVEGQIRSALQRYARMLRTEIVPRARGAQAEGISSLPRGKTCYAALILGHTTLPLSPEEAHRTGLGEIARIDRELGQLGKQLFDLPTLSQVLEHLRSDPQLYFQTERQIVSAAENALAKAKLAMPRFFGTLPKTDCIVRKIPSYEAPYTTIAYYREPHPDGSKPGEYMVNVFLPQTRPRFEAEVLAFHESIPGHHLQIALAQEHESMPAFRKHEGMSAFVEGWALYSERLSDEMGLYGSDLDRIGMLSFDAWRAARLVVDTGIHAFGWSRQRAERYMLEHTALTPSNIQNEVDRYIVWPAQALAYKTGQLALIRLRKRAETELGPHFRIAAFHDAVLGRGAVSLPLLEAQIERYIADNRPAQARIAPRSRK
jgi:uncharacterized protein (DUF885 family)